MPHHDTTALSGVIQHVFAHRFTLEADGGFHLADLGPKGLEAFPLEQGLTVTLEGEKRPSEIKVTRIASPGRNAVDIHHKKPNHAPKGGHGDDADPAPALKAVSDAGWTSKGVVRRTPKHFEVLARQGDGAWTELHVDVAGRIGKTKPADTSKWSADLG